MRRASSAEKELWPLTETDARGNFAGRAVQARLSRGELNARPDAVLRVLREESSLRHYLPLIERVIAQTRARVFEARAIIQRRF